MPELIEPRVRPVGNGEVRRVLPHRTHRMVGPFIFADLIGPEVVPPGAGTDVDAHPHIGLATVTYLFAGRMVHRDSTGAVATIEPGAVNWMTAGRGVTHTERTHPERRASGGESHGLQTWVALPDDAEDGAASFHHSAADSIPEVTHGGTTIRVAVGSSFGETSPVPTSSPLILAEVRVTTESPIAVDATHPERGVLAVDDGITLDGRPLPEGSLAVLDDGTSPVIGGSGRAIVLGGEPVGPRVIWWNFVHSSRERIDEAKDDWRHQRFPMVPGDHDPWVPLPE